MVVPLDAVSDRVSETEASTSAFSVTTAKTRGETGSVYSDAVNSVTSLASSQSRKTTGSSKQSEKEIVRGNGATTLVTTEVQTDDELLVHPRCLCGCVLRV